VRREDIPMRNAMNEVVRESYVRDCEKGLARWNKLLEEAGYPHRMMLPSTRFRRTVGSWANVPTDLKGTPISAAEFAAHETEWLPTEIDRAYVRSLMKGVFERGKMAGWIAPPERGINTKPTDFEYVKLH
jgi:benzoyl-CoA 2,3-dioxygenase component B